MTPEQQARKSAGGTGRLAPRTRKERAAADAKRDLPKLWRRLPSATLEAWAAEHPDHPGVDEVLLELDDREHQAAANDGAMNGLAPESE